VQAYRPSAAVADVEAVASAALVVAVEVPPVEAALGRALTSLGRPFGPVRRRLDQPGFLSLPSIESRPASTEYRLSALPSRSP
jgi:hypothetical protein